MSYSDTVKAMQSRVPAYVPPKQEEGYSVIADGGAVLLEFTGAKSRAVRMQQKHEGSTIIGIIRTTH